MRRVPLIFLVFLTTGCEPQGNPHVADLTAPSGTYVVRLSGRITKPEGLFTISEHRLRTEIYKDRTLYVPAREIYFADSMDTAFKDRYRTPEWVAPNVLRFPGNWGRREGALDILKVRNGCQVIIRSVRISTAQDMFIILDLAPGTEMVLSMTAQAPSGDLNWFHVVAEWGAGNQPSEADGSFRLLGGSQSRYEFVASLSPDRIEFAETRGQSEWYR